MPIGARNVERCFSAANMKMVKANPAVRNISKKRPRTTDMPAPNVVAIKKPCNVDLVSDGNPRSED